MGPAKNLTPKRKPRTRQVHCDCDSCKNSPTPTMITVPFSLELTPHHHIIATGHTSSFTHTAIRTTKDFTLYELPPSS